MENKMDWTLVGLFFCLAPFVISAMLGAWAVSTL